MNVVQQWEYLLTKAIDVHFKEGRENVEEIYSQYLMKGDSSQHDFRDATSVGLGKMGYTNEGGMMHLDQYTPGTERVTKFKKYTLGFIIGEELISDMATNRRTRQDQYPLFTDFASDGRDSADWTIETICTQFHTNATSTTKTNTWPGAGRDGIALAGTHTTTRGGVSWVNLMGGATLNPVSIAEAVTILELQPDETGRQQGAITEVDIVIGRYWQWRAGEIEKTSGQLDTNNNNINLIRARKVKFNFIVNPYLSETYKGWLVLAGGKHKLKYFLKQKPTLSKQSDVYTGNRIFRIMMRFGIDFFSARGVVYNPGL